INADATANAHREFALMFDHQDFRGAADLWTGRQLQPVNTGELATATEAFAQAGDARAAAYAQRLAAWQPIEADAIVARLALQQRQFREASILLQRAFKSYRATPWPNYDVMHRALETAIATSRADRASAQPLFDALNHSFAASQLEESRRVAMLTIASGAEGCGPHTVSVLRSFEPHPRWRNDDLALRASCYAQSGLGDLAEKAADDYRSFLAHQVQLDFQ